MPRLSTAMARPRSPLKAYSHPRLSKLPSKTTPTTSPSRFTTGLPEWPAVTSAVVTSRAEWPGRVRLCAAGSGWEGSPACGSSRAGPWRKDHRWLSVTGPSGSAAPAPGYPLTEPYDRRRLRWRAEERRCLTPSIAPPTMPRSACRPTSFPSATFEGRGRAARSAGPAGRADRAAPPREPTPPGRPGGGRRVFEPRPSTASADLGGSTRPEDCTTAGWGGPSSRRAPARASVSRTSSRSS